MEDLRSRLKEELIEEAGGWAPGDVVVTGEGVGEDDPGGGEEDGEEVTGGHGEEDRVGGGLHAGLAQDNDGEAVGEEGDQHEEGHHEAIQGLHQVQGAKPGGGVHHVAAARFKAAGNRIFNRKFMLLTYMSDIFFLSLH